MSRKSAALISILLAAAVCAAYIGLRHPRVRKESQGPPAGSVVQNPAHERASLEELLKRRPGHAPILLRLAQLDMEEGQPAAARARLEQLLAQEPANVDALIELGRACFEAGDAACAWSSTAKALGQNPEHPGALYNMGALNANQGRFDKARELWNRAVRVAPGSDGGRKAAEALRRLR
jgi:tetratricopeptide (TPR) repeat protein